MLFSFTPEVKVNGACRTLMTKIILEVLWHPAAIPGGITDDFELLFRNHLYIRTFIECIENDISILGSRIRETEHNGFSPVGTSSVVTSWFARYTLYNNKVWQLPALWNQLARWSWSNTSPPVIGMMAN